jgi:hypothetical protein
MLLELLVSKRSEVAQQPLTVEQLLEYLSITVKGRLCQNAVPFLPFKAIPHANACCGQK